jgi:toxin secretion/phage lysis holin
VIVENLSAIYKSLAFAGGALASYFFGGWSDALQTLAIFVLLDYITGFAASFREGKLSSNVGLWGIARKTLIFAVVAAGHLLDQLLGDGHMLRDGAVMFYIANEAVSILENLGRLGVPIPDRIRQAIEILRGKEKMNNVPK